MFSVTGRLANPKLLPLIPALLFSGTFLAGLSSLLIDSVASGTGDVWSLQHYRRFLFDAFYFQYLVRSIRVAFITTMAASVIGYAMAYWMSHGSAFVRRSLLLLLIFQFFTVTVTRVYAIWLLLGNGGLINRLVMSLGISAAPLPLVNHEAGVVIGLVAAALPFAVLPIFSTMMGRRVSLEEAASTLGARRSIVFWRIIFPLSLPGVVASVILVFLYSLGALITPSIIGGGFVDLIAGFAYEQAVQLSNPSFAAAGATVTLLVAFLMVLGLQLLYNRLSRDR
jgi:ABC-type spermidine/putrescine transport system permease subunit I